MYSTSSSTFAVLCSSIVLTEQEQKQYGKEKISNDFWETLLYEKTPFRGLVVDCLDVDYHHTRKDPFTKNDKQYILIVKEVCITENGQHVCEINSEILQKFPGCKFILQTFLDDRS